MASRTNILRTVLRCGVAFGALPVAQMASAGPADTQVPSATGIEEVVVTAEKRSEKLSQVPSAVTSISADQLQAAGALTIRDIAASVPGLQVSQSAGSGEFTIRGITSGNDVNPTVGLLIDGVPIGPVAFGAAGNNLQPELDPSLLSRVEVLRGPQGTLYGSSTLGGIVDYITKAPNLAETEGSIYAEADATEHGDPSEVIRGVFSAPLIQDRVGFQASAFGDNLGGFIDDNARKLNDINYNHSYGGRLAVSAQIDPDLQVEVSDLYSNTRSVEGFVIYNPATRKPAAGDLTYNNVVLPTYDNAFNMLSLNANYDLHWATLSYLGSYQYLSAGSDYDYSAASLGAIVTSYLPAFGGLTLPSPPNPGVFEGLNSHKLTQEVRLASPSATRNRRVASRP